MLFRSYFSLAALMSTAFLSSCATTYGSKTVQPTRGDYNQAITASESEQLLANIVRLRYRDPPSFLALTSVVTQFEYGRDASLGGNISGGAGLGVGGNLGLGANYREKPTVSYAPLSGRDFARRMLSPISPDALLLLSQEGWSIARMVVCCVDRINGVINAPRATGPTPDIVPDNRKVRRLAALLRKLQVAGLLRVVRSKQGSEARPVVRIDSGVSQDPELTEVEEELYALLGMVEKATPTPDEVVGEDLPERDHGDQHLNEGITLRGRSLLGSLFALSHAVDIPQAHRNSGIVTSSTATPGGPKTWFEMMNGLFRVRYSKGRPKNAFVATRYRDYWFYIEDSDLEAKTTFLLINYLQALQSAAVTGSPILTLPAGG